MCWLLGRHWSGETAAFNSDRVWKTVSWLHCCTTYKENRNQFKSSGKCRNSCSEKRGNHLLDLWLLTLSRKMASTRQIGGLAQCVPKFLNSQKAHNDFDTSKEICKCNLARRGKIVATLSDSRWFAPWNQLPHKHKFQCCGTSQTASNAILSGNSSYTSCVQVRILKLVEIIDISAARGQTCRGTSSCRGTSDDCIHFSQAFSDPQM